MSRMLSSLALAGVAAAAAAAIAERPSPRAAADQPVITGFFPQALGGDLQASVIAVEDSVTTLLLCGDGTNDKSLCDLMAWTYIVGESTAAIHLSALENKLDIACDVTSGLNVATCEATATMDGTSTVDVIVLNPMSDFVTSVTITGGASLLTDVPSATKTGAKSASTSFAFPSSSSTTRGPNKTDDSSFPTRTSDPEDDGGDDGGDGGDDGGDDKPDIPGAASGLAQASLAGVVAVLGAMGAMMF